MLSIKTISNKYCTSYLSRSAAVSHCYHTILCHFQYNFFLASLLSIIHTVWPIYIYLLSFPLSSAFPVCYCCLFYIYIVLFPRVGGSGQHTVLCPSFFPPQNVNDLRKRGRRDFRERVWYPADMCSLIHVQGTVSLSAFYINETVLSSIFLSTTSFLAGFK
jgi:hypothetical protein